MVPVSLHSSLLGLLEICCGAVKVCNRYIAVNLFVLYLCTSVPGGIVFTLALSIFLSILLYLTSFVPVNVIVIVYHDRTTIVPPGVRPSFGGREDGPWAAAAPPGMRRVRCDGGGAHRCKTAYYCRRGYR